MRGCVATTAGSASGLGAVILVINSANGKAIRSVGSGERSS